MNRLTTALSSSGDGDDITVDVHAYGVDQVRLTIGSVTQSMSLLGDLLTVRQLVVEVDRQLTHLAEDREDGTTPEEDGPVPGAMDPYGGDAWLPAAESATPEGDR